MSIGKNIKLRREQLGISVDELAEKIGKNRATIYRYENGDIEKLPTDALIPLAKALGTTPAHLMGWEDETHQPISKSPKREEKLSYSEYPYIPDAVAAGIPETIDGMSNLPKIPIADEILGKYARRKNIIIMRVNGESMNRVIQNGSIIGVYTDIDAKNLKDGDLVVFNHDYNYSLKRFYRTPELLIFRPDSTDASFTDIIYKVDDDIRIVGKVIMSSISYK